MTENNLSPEITTMPISVIEEGKALEQIRTQYHTAVRVQQPRNLAVVQKNVLLEAELAGKAFFYSWPIRKNGAIVSHVKGHSIGLAISVAREFTNCAILPEVIETVEAYLFTAHFVDIEKGVTFSRIYRQDKSKNIGMKDEDRAKDIIFQIGQSKAIRNVIAMGIPKWLIDQAVEVAMRAVEKGITRENLQEKISNALETFAEKGVQEGIILAHLGKARGYITKDDLVYLWGLKTRLDDGETIESVFPETNIPEPSSTPVKSATEILKEQNPISPPPSAEDDKPRTRRTRYCQVCKQKKSRDEMASLDKEGNGGICSDCAKTTSEPFKEETVSPVPQTSTPPQIAKPPVPPVQICSTCGAKAACVPNHFNEEKLICENCAIEAGIECEECGKPLFEAFKLNPEQPLLELNELSLCLSCYDLKK